MGCGRKVQPGLPVCRQDGLTDYDSMSLSFHCRDPETILKFSTDAVNHVAEAYCPIVRKHKDDPYTPEEKQWQQVRSSRSRWRHLGFA